MAYIYVLGALSVQIGRPQSSYGIGTILISRLRSILETSARANDGFTVLKFRDTILVLQVHKCRALPIYILSIETVASRIMCIRACYLIVKRTAIPYVNGVASITSYPVRAVTGSSSVKTSAIYVSLSAYTKVCRTQETQNCPTSP